MDVGNTELSDTYKRELCSFKRDLIDKYFKDRNLADTEPIYREETEQEGFLVKHTSKPPLITYLATPRISQDLQQYLDMDISQKSP